MNFETFFRLISYAAVFCGFLSLWVSGTLGIIVTALFLGVMLAAWFLEDTRWQISEKLGTALIVLALPAFMLAWKFELVTFYGGEVAIAGILARLILSLSAIKLLQEKSSRDWVFLYLMSFFQVMLAAGLSISALYFASFIAYLLVMVCAIIAFEIRKTSLAVAPVSKPGTAPGSEVTLAARRLPVTSIVLIGFIALIAVPLFFMLPRVGGAGIGGNQGGVSTRSGFSDTVRLGGVGLIQENDAVVMRVKLDNDKDHHGLYFRGIALDTFDNQAWSKSRSGIREPFEKGDRDVIQIETKASRENLVIQTVYLEPLDTPVLFALPRAILVQGNFPVLYKDLYGAVTFQPNFERVSYKVLSDRSLPPPLELRADVEPYNADISSFLQLPPIYDPRIAELAEQVTAGAVNRYDKAKLLEGYLQSQFGYTLQRKAGGREPLADFLFNVKEGHCEYFATAMAVMLRTQGIASRVVNGFHGGDFNDAAGVVIVRQRNAHAWVEVYFPESDTWVPFDPTPAAGLAEPGFGAGFAGTIKKYMDALETFWIQYFVAFDDQEQRSLGRTVRGGMAGVQTAIAGYFAAASEIGRAWWAAVQGEEGAQARITAILRGLGVVTGIAVVVIVVFWLYRRVARLPWWQRFRRAPRQAADPPILHFYKRMQDMLASRGVSRPSYQTPLEFASGLNMPEAVMITDKYNRVRFGDKELSAAEAAEIESWLGRLEESEPPA